MTPSDPPIGDLADSFIQLAHLALQFGQIDRTACYHPDGLTKESDTDHTVMLGWLAPALAARYYPTQLDAGLVAQFALVHDAVEVYAGDTPTLRIDAQGRQAKHARERAAADRIRGQFTGQLPWFPRMIDLYEEQELPEARFVRALDKILPKAVHLGDDARGLVEHGMGLDELTEVFARQADDMAGYAGEFGVLMALRAELVERTLRLLARVTLETRVAAEQAG